METRECKIHGILPKTSEYFYIRKYIDKRNRNKTGERTVPDRLAVTYSCRQCSLKSGRNTCKNSVENLYKSYIRKCLKNDIKKITNLKYKDIILNEELVDIKYLQLKTKRIFKYNFENKDFTCLRHLSKYIELNYNIPYRTFEKRLESGISIFQAVNFKNHDKRFKANKKSPI